MSAKLTVVLSCLLAVGAVGAAPDSTGAATVCVARNETILVPQGIFAPKLLYPQGRVDFDVVEQLLDRSMLSLTGKPPAQAWQQFCVPSGTVGIMVEAGRYPVQVATVEILVDRLVNAGIPPSNIIVFSGDERDLFAAGFNINHDPAGVRVLGAESEGFRGGISRIVSDYCDTLISVGSLQVDPDLGMAGCLASTLAAVPNAQRLALRRDPLALPSVAAHPALRHKIRLNVLEAYVPLVDFVGEQKTAVQYRGLLVGTDMVAVDAVGRKVLQGCRNKQGGREGAPGGDWPLPSAPDYLAAARDVYHLGQSDPKDITVRLIGYAEDAFVN
jgi:hypothetical protein